MLFSFFSMTATLFDVPFCIFKLKDFNYCNSFVPPPFNKLGYYIVTQLSNMEIMKQCCIPENNLFLDNMTFWVLTHFNFALVLPHYIAAYDTHFLLLYPNFHIFLHSLQMINIITWFSFMIHQLVGYCLVITTKVMNPISFLWISFHLSRLECFSADKPAIAKYWSLYFLFIT